MPGSPAVFIRPCMNATLGSSSPRTIATMSSYGIVSATSAPGSEPAAADAAARRRSRVPLARHRRERRARRPRCRTRSHPARRPAIAGEPLVAEELRHQRVAADELRGTSFHGTSRDASGSFGSPSTRSPRMLRMMSDVPPSMVLACARRKPRARRCAWSSAAPRDEARTSLRAVEPVALPRHAVGALEVDRELLQPLVELACCSLVIEPSGPASAPRAPAVGGALVVEP